jgi:polar amino acid transport system substrate-binding protein
MKCFRLVSGLAAAILLMAALAGCAQPATPTAAPAASAGGGNGQHFAFASDASFPPMEYVDDKTKQVVGFDPDLLAAVAKDQNFTYDIKNTAWDGIFAGLASGQYDAIISSVTVTADRQKQYDFSDPYFDANQGIVVRPDNTDIKTGDDLKGKIVGCQIGTTGAIAVAKYKNIKLKSYDEAGLAVEDLYVGRIDAVVLDSPTARSYVLRNPRYQDRLKIVGSPFTDEHYGIAVKKGNARALAMINRGLESISKDGTLARIAHKWLE